MEIWFWVHSSHIEIDLVHNYSDLRRETMAECSMWASGEFGEAKDDGGVPIPVYSSHWIITSDLNVKEVDKQIYRLGGQSGWFCSKNISVSGAVRMADVNGITQPKVNYYFTVTPEYCFYAGF